MVSYYFGSKERMLEALIIYRATDLKMQDYFTNGKPRSIAINKLIELYVTVYITIAKFINSYILNFHQKKEVSI
jgi:AcrR family transcriptional regulator